ncbi:MAG: phosphatidylserine/phosphatidylglycerophosphate/cardiolipin synthase family protein [Verrucomicrobiota bacterium]
MTTRHNGLDGGATKNPGLSGLFRLPIFCSVFRGPGGWLLLALLAGCASPSPRVRYLEEMQPASLTNLAAYRADTNLEIRIPLRGKDAYAHANWPPVEAGGTNYQQRFAVLTFETEKPAARRAAVNRNNQVALRDAPQWKQLLQRIFSGLAPAAPGHGALLLAENEEIVIFRDQTGKVSEVKLENKPPEIVVDQTFNDTDFSRLAIHLLETGVLNLDRSQWQFLFVTGENPGFVFMDLRQRLVVFLAYPGDPETQELPAAFAVRALNSLLIRSLLVTAVKNPGTLLARGFWHLGTSGAAAIASGPESPGGPPPALSTGPGMDLAAWEKDLDRMVSARRYQGKVELLIDGAKFFPALIQSVEGAARGVDAQVFIFDNDDYAVKIADLLKKRSAEVKVRVLMDDAGSLFAGNAPRAAAPEEGFQRPAGMQGYLTSGSQVQARASANPWLTVDHRKLFIIDGRQAYLGGMNIGRQYRYEWHDLMVGLTGPVVGRLEKSYRKAWAHAGPLGDFSYAWVMLFEPAAPGRNRMPDGIDIRPLRTATFQAEIYHAQLEAINRAKSYIYIENAYFDDNTMLRALIQARRRGVDVRVIFPAENDSGIMQTSDEVTGNELIENGARVYVYPGMTHVKAAIYDGWACLGSANFNKMSLHVGQELDVAFSDPATVERLKQELFETDFKRSRELTQPVPLNWFDSFVKAFADEL